MKLVTVTLNPVLDRVYLIPGYSAGGVFRTGDAVVSAGGKGVNVARVWTTLGGLSVATGFLGGRNGEAAAEMMAAERIEARFFPIAGETRITTAVFDPTTGYEAVINEPGPEISPDEAAPFIDHLARLIKAGADYLCISGSAPPGVDVSIYPRMVELAHRLNVPVAVDASGDALLAAAGASPTLLKPNREEAQALGVAIPAWDDALAAAEEIRCKYGAKIVAITGGSDGAVAASADGAWIAATPQVRVVSTLGSGDSFMAGFLYGLREGTGCERALELGIACGAVNATTPGAGHVGLAAIEEISGRIKANTVA